MSKSVISDASQINKTDILLQKVSDTLSGSNMSSPPPSPPPSPEDSGVEIPSFSSDDLKQPLNTKESSKTNMARSVSETLVSSSNQNTSDYVSASGEDLAINDWDYQIPAPPTEFRDDIETKQSEQSPRVDSTTIADVVDYCAKQEQPQLSKQASLEEKQLKQKVISELESKIESSRGRPETTLDKIKDLVIEKEAKIAPADNTLANFVITTYSKQKNLDIFEPSENCNNRILNTFATLTRNGNNRLLDEEKRTNVQRSKSYIVLSSNEKFQGKAKGKTSLHKTVEDQDDAISAINGTILEKKFTSVTDVAAEHPMNEELAAKEKIVRWKEKANKTQDEPKTEQLQSIQVKYRRLSIFLFLVLHGSTRGILWIY